MKHSPTWSAFRQPPRDEAQHQWPDDWLSAPAAPPPTRVRTSKSAVSRHEVGWGQRPRGRAKWLSGSSSLLQRTSACWRTDFDLQPLDSLSLLIDVWGNKRSFFETLLLHMLVAAKRLSAHEQVDGQQQQWLPPEWHDCESMSSLVLYYCNSRLQGRLNKCWTVAQLIQNAAARVQTGTSRKDHGTRENLLWVRLCRVCCFSSVRHSQTIGERLCE